MHLRHCSKLSRRHVILGTRSYTGGTGLARANAEKPRRQWTLVAGFSIGSKTTTHDAMFGKSASPSVLSAETSLRAFLARKSLQMGYCSLQFRPHLASA